MTKRARTEQLANQLIDDLLSYFAHGTIDSEPLSHEVIQDLAWRIMSGGVDTTGSAAANPFLHLGLHPRAAAPAA
jgi:cytochrome P450